MFTITEATGTTVAMLPAGLVTIIVAIAIVAAISVFLRQLIFWIAP